MQSITSEANAQSTTSTTLKEHNETKTLTQQEGEAQSWFKTLIFEQKPTKIGAQSLQSIERFLTLAKYLQTNVFNTKIKEKSIPHDDNSAT